MKKSIIIIIHNHLFILMAFPRSFSQFFLEQSMGVSSNEETEKKPTFSRQQPTFSSGKESEQNSDFLSNYASLFKIRDLHSLKVTFRSATKANDVIPLTNLNGTL
jgi:hypothetical protein